MRISDWSSDVCSSDLQSATSNDLVGGCLGQQGGRRHRIIEPGLDAAVAGELAFRDGNGQALALGIRLNGVDVGDDQRTQFEESEKVEKPVCIGAAHRSEEHTSELQSLMRISYAVFCLKKKKQTPNKKK